MISTYFGECIGEDFANCAARILENAPTATKADAEEVKKRRKRSEEKRKKKDVKEGATRGAGGGGGGDGEERSKSRKTGSLLAPRGPFLLAFLHGRPLHDLSC